MPLPSSLPADVVAAVTATAAAVPAQIFTTDQQLAFELQGASFKLHIGTLQVGATAACMLTHVWCDMC